MGDLRHAQPSSPPAGRLQRRSFLIRTAALGLAVSPLGALLAACGTTAASPTAMPAGAASVAPSAAPAVSSAPAASAAPAATATKPAATSPAASASAAASAPPSVAAAGTAPVGGKRLTISSISLTFGTSLLPNDGPGLKMINERFNIDYQPQFVPQGSYTEKLSTVIAGGDIPDMIAFFDTQQMALFYKWSGQSAFMAVDDQLKPYPNFSYISDPVWNAVKVKGKRYALPHYYPPYALSPSIRQDWLDNLGLKMPTSYAELKQVATAFTTGDPAKDGSKHYGIAIGSPINPHYAMGAYWDPTAWYHKDQQGNYLPGSIATGSKERIGALADLYAQGGITRDFAVMKNWPDINKEFYGGKAGIFIGAPRGMSQDYMKGLLEIHPNARPVPIPPFKSSDGGNGYAATSGFSGVTAISAKAAKDPEKVQRMLMLLNFGRTFYPTAQQNSQNADYDWYLGRVGQGYDMKNGVAVMRDSSTNPVGLAPVSYMPGGTAWPPTDDAINYQEGYTLQPRMGEWAGALQKMWTETKPYHSPHYGIISSTQQAKGGDLDTFLANEMTKMISGQRAIDSWDEMVKQYLGMGGQAVIDEVNQGIRERG